MTDKKGNMVDFNTIVEKVKSEECKHIDLLKASLLASFEGVTDFQVWIRDQMKEVGLEVEEFVVDLEELERQPAMFRTLRTEPAKLVRGPNFVGKLDSSSDRTTPRQKGVLLFAHADKPADTYEWGRKYRVEKFARGRCLSGPGIADDVAGISACLSAVKIYRELGMEPHGEVRVASVLGKQLGIFGTYGLVTKYSPTDAAIYVHPPASGGGLRDLIIGALGMVEFHIEIKGRPPATTEPWKPIFEDTGVNPIYKGLDLTQKLREWAFEVEKSQMFRHKGVEAVAGKSFALSIGRFLSGEEGAAYQIPSHCRIEGVVHFSPRACVANVQKSLEETFERLKAQDPWLSQSNVTFEWGDVIADAFEVEPHNSFVQEVKRTVEEAAGRSPSFYYGHSVSDLRYPVLWWKVPSVGLGPLAGDLGTPDEYVDRDEYLTTVAVLVALLARFA